MMMFKLPLMGMTFLKETGKQVFLLLCNRLATKVLLLKGLLISSGPSSAQSQLATPINTGYSDVQQPNMTASWSASGRSVAHATHVPKDPYL